MNTIKIKGVYVGIPGKSRTYNGVPTVWPSIARQVKEAQADNRARYSQSSHKPVQLYTMAEYCVHQDPDYLDKYDGVEDLRDEFLAGIGLDADDSNLSAESKSVYYRLRYKNGLRANAVIPLLAEFEKDLSEYEDSHDSRLCLDDPCEVACLYCDADELDYGDGVIDAGCNLSYEVQEAWDNFWDSVSPEGYAYIQEKHREQA